MIEITCDKCKKKVSVNVKTVTAKTLSKLGYESVSLDGETNYHLCFSCLEDLESWVETPDLMMG